jgi:hypothetical protein
VSSARLLLTCVAEDTPGFHARVETLVGSARRLGGSLAGRPIVVNMVDGADPAFVRRMEAAKAEVRVVPRVTDGGFAYANKLRMLELHERDDFDVLLAVDCDIAVAGDPASHVPDDAIGVVPADLDPFTDRQWRRIFDGLGSDPGPRSLRATASGRPIYPYFNSGVVAVPRRLCAELCTAWTQALRDVDDLWRRHPGTVPPGKRFYADQLALAVALWRGLPWTVASRELNFATHVPLHGPTVRGLRPVLLHYHTEVDERGFLLRPRCPVAEPAAERVNRSRAQALGLPYDGLERRPVSDRARRAVRRRVRRS